MADPDFGTGLSVLPDLGEKFALKSGKANLAEAIARRLMTPRGGLFYAPAYGEDVRLYLNETIDAAKLIQIEVAVAAQCEQDERVLAASVSAAHVFASDKLTLTIELETAAGPFLLILAVGALTVEILRAE